MKRITLALLGLLAASAGAQATPERTLGAPTVIGSEPFRNIAGIRELSDGRVLVAQRGPPSAMVQNMISAFARASGRGRGAGADSLLARTFSPRNPAPARVVLLDATLQVATPVGQAGSGPNDYQQPEGLRSGLADTTLLIDLGRSDVLVIDPAGRLVAARPIPGGLGAQLAVGGAAVDRSGRLVFEPRGQVTRSTAAGTEVGMPDSVRLTAVDFKSGATTPVAWVRVAGMRSLMVPDSARPGAMQMRMQSVPFPVIDDWVMMPDGTLAIIRGADLHIEWIAPNGKSRMTPPIPYARQAVSDSDKVKFLKRPGLPDSIPMLPRGLTMVQLDPDSFPRFKPPFSVRGALAASDGTVWLPSKIISPAAPDGYAVIGPDGRLREIVHFMKGQRLVGFGKGVAYVAVNQGPQDNRIARVALH